MHLFECNFLNIIFLTLPTQNCQKISHNPGVPPQLGDADMLP